MQVHRNSGIRRTMAVACFTMAAAGIIPAQHALAQDAEWPSNAETYPGQIVYSRDVPYGTATRRFEQGEASTVSPDQSVLITNSLLTGLEPLSDAEQSLVSAPLSQALGSTQSALQTGLSALSSTHASEGDFARAESGPGNVGGLINNSLSALPATLGIIGKALGDGQ